MCVENGDFTMEYMVTIHEDGLIVLSNSSTVAITNQGEGGYQDSRVYYLPHQSTLVNECKELLTAFGSKCDLAFWKIYRLWPILTSC